MKKNRYLLVLCICLATIILLPFVRQVLLGQEMRLPPGFVPKQEETQPQEQEVTEQPADAALTPQPLEENAENTLAFESDYGYYENDRWTEAQCGFYVTAPRAGEVRLSIYYPFEITGDQVGHVFVDGQPYIDFTLETDAFEITVPCVTEQKHYIQINCDFAKEPGEEDKRALAFVLQDIAFVPDGAQ